MEAIKLTVFGKNDVMFILKKELKNTSKTAIKNKKCSTEYKYVVKIMFIRFSKS